jgi:hypothetical protein
MRYSDAQRAEISATAKGKTIASLEWTTDPEIGPCGGYWTMRFIDGSEMSFLFMAELLVRGNLDARIGRDGAKES